MHSQIKSVHAREQFGDDEIIATIEGESRWSIADQYEGLPDCNVLEGLL